MLRGSLRFRIKEILKLWNILLKKFGRKYVKRSYKSNSPNYNGFACNNVEMFDLLVFNMELKLHVSIFGMEFASRGDFGLFRNLKRLIEQTSILYRKEILFWKCYFKERSFWRRSVWTFDVIDELVNLDKQMEDKFIEMAKYLLDHGADIEFWWRRWKLLVKVNGITLRKGFIPSLITAKCLEKPLQLIKHKNILISIAICGKNMQFSKKVITLQAQM